LDVGKCVEARASLGGPASKAMKSQLDGLKRAAKTHGKIVGTRMKGITKAETKLLKEVKRISK